MITTDSLSRWQAALPFWVSLLLIPLIWVAAFAGGWWVLLVPLSTWWAFAVLDRLTGLNLENADPDTPDTALHWYILLTKAWVPVQFLTLFGLIWFATHTDHLSTASKIGLFFGMGVISGTIGINYSHELMHQKGRAERWLGDILLAMVLYSHFRSEHLLVHHRFVGTPRDPVTARYNEGFHRFYPRVLWQCLTSAFRAERDKLARKDRPWTDRANPFWRYWALQAGMLLLALLIGGLSGLALFLIQAGVAIWQLELVNYVEHYGLTRKHLGEGKYEHVQPRHSWNASQKASNWLLINLQRHSDHHYKPNRRFPLLQHHSQDAAPQLPYGYPVMTVAAMIPPLWRRVMNPRVKAWRRQYYPEITDWSPYNKSRNPLPPA
ncbi:MULTISPECIES: alkane 1-monooxygenase [unclassified Ruegeria]|uniref:alkane 1-monooxygenase n=1 Tax=unclassified Ruegeria TaxID=2625375 RepID=UPI001ADA7371|nr:MULTISPECIES: alkane 1-monooxygenase [unclassified Ruegeria]MBO9413121.1 alkane 1-monooxygenase [Ruegeria sp. R8_1]MBO9416895.1 alkane 1-monooxygenase [Ruegeria sp. R8_2]